eukprot:2942564-Prymnesium_polylepis.1
MKAADLDGLHKSGQLKSFDKRTTSGQVTNFVRGRRRDVPLACVRYHSGRMIWWEAMRTMMGCPRAYCRWSGPPRAVCAHRRRLRLLGLQRLSRYPFDHHPLWATVSIRYRWHGMHTACRCRSPSLETPRRPHPIYSVWPPNTVTRCSG